MILIVECSSVSVFSQNFLSGAAKWAKTVLKTSGLRVLCDRWCDRWYDGEVREAGSESGVI